MTEIKLPRLRNFIGDEFVEPLTRDETILDPSDQNLLAYQAGTSREAMDRALQNAQDCHRSQAWYGLGEQRAHVLQEVAKRLESHTEELATMESMNTGIVIAHTRNLMRLLPLIFRAAAQQVLRHPDLERLEGPGQVELWHKPWGPAVCLGPWNSPAPIGAHKLASALAAGAPVILKPSEYTPFTTQRLFEIIAECGLPSGAAQLIHGGATEGRYLVEDTRSKAVSFTGGLSGGQAVGRLCMQDMKPVQLELGGHNPFLILPDADLDQVLDGLLFGLTTLNGQWCRAIGRIFAPRAMKQDILDGLLARFGNLRMGPATDEQSAMGPLVHRQHKQGIIQSLLDLQSLGGTVHTNAASQFDEGCFLAPRIVTNVPAKSDKKEIFGPVATLHAYDDVEDLVALANDSPFGLAAYIYGADAELNYRIARQLDFGSTKINGVSLTSINPSAPRAAWGASGLGEEGGFETFRFFQGSVVVGSINNS